MWFIGPVFPWYFFASVVPSARLAQLDKIAKDVHQARHVTVQVTTFVFGVSLGSKMW